jgi:hypothetical protein
MFNFDPKSGISVHFESVVYCAVLSIKDDKLTIHYVRILDIHAMRGERQLSAFLVISTRSIKQRLASKAFKKCRLARIVKPTPPLLFQPAVHTDGRGMQRAGDFGL